MAASRSPGRLRKRRATWRDMLSLKFIAADDAAGHGTTSAVTMTARGRLIGAFIIAATHRMQRRRRQPRA